MADTVANIGAMVARLVEEVTSIYLVADGAEVDWCPCCGVNLRLRIGGRVEGEVDWKNTSRGAAARRGSDRAGG
jgi:hypothetical protein